MPQKEFGVLVGIGPGEREINRLADLLDSLFVYEPTTPWVLLVDDGREDRSLAGRFSTPSTCELTSIFNARPLKRRQRLGSKGGLTSSILLGLDWIARNKHPLFVLKVDTDSLVIGPFAKTICEVFMAEPSVGMVGEYRSSMEAGRRFRDFARWVSYLGRRSRLRIWMNFHQSLFGRSKTVRRHILRARREGYIDGEYCQGGGYALSGEAIRKMKKAGCLEDPLLWLREPRTEDTIVSMYVRTVNMEIKGLTDDGQPFGVKWRGLVDSLDHLLHRGFSIVHSVKNDPSFSEDEIRDFFRNHRTETRNRIQNV